MLKQLSEDGISTATCDVCSQDSVDACIAGILQQAGSIDVLINNAGEALSTSRTLPAGQPSLARCAWLVYAWLKPFARPSCRHSKISTIQSDTHMNNILFTHIINTADSLSSCRGAGDWATG